MKSDLVCNQHNTLPLNLPVVLFTSIIPFFITFIPIHVYEFLLLFDIVSLSDFCMYYVSFVPIDQSCCQSGIILKYVTTCLIHINCHSIFVKID